MARASHLHFTGPAVDQRVSCKYFIKVIENKTAYYFIKHAYNTDAYKIFKNNVINTQSHSHRTVFEFPAAYALKTN